MIPTEPKIAMLASAAMLKLANTVLEGKSRLEICLFSEEDRKAVLTYLDSEQVQHEALGARGDADGEGAKYFATISFKGSN